MHTMLIITHSVYLVREMEEKGEEEEKGKGKGKRNDVVIW